MSLLAADYATLKSNILADPSLASAVAAGDWVSIAAAYNAPSSPAVNLWRPSIPVDELKNAIDWTAGANGFLSLTVAKQNGYFALTQGTSVDATQANIRNGFSAIFTASVASALQAVAQVVGTRFQVLFSTNNVSTYFGRTLSWQDIQFAMTGN